MKWLWRRLFRHRDEMTNHDEEDAALVDAQERVERLETKADKKDADRDLRQRRAQMGLDARRRHP